MVPKLSRGILNFFMDDSPSENKKTRQLGWRVGREIAHDIEAMAESEGRSPGKQLEQIYKQWKLFKDQQSQAESGKKGGWGHPPSAQGRKAAGDR